MNTKRTFLLILLCALTAAMLTAFSACEEIDVSNTKNLDSVTVVNVPETTVPIGGFDDAGIILQLNYSDETIEQIPLTEKMLPIEYRELLQTPGTHNIAVMYRKKVAAFTLKVGIEHVVTFKNALGVTVKTCSWAVGDEPDISAPTDEEMQVEGYRFLGTYDSDYASLTEGGTVTGNYVKTWKVYFYNNDVTLIKTVVVDDGEAAAEPTEAERAADGYNWIVWDKNFSHVTADIQVCGFYVAVTTEPEPDPEPAADEYFLFYLLPDNTYSVSPKNFDDLPFDIVIPAEFEGISVTAIGENAFKNCAAIESVTIPSSIVSIGKDAFRGCASLTYVSLGGVKTLGEGAFWGCKNLSFVSASDNLTSIGYRAFFNCGSLSAFIIGGEVTSIGEEAFYNCGLEEIIVPATVNSVGNSAFNSCTSLTSATVGSGYISGNMFYGCTVLECVTIGNSVTSIGYHAFENCTSLASVTIPDSVTSIGNYAFHYCTSLASITIPDSVTSIGSYAFHYCTSLASITIPDSVTSIGYEAFDGCTSLASITIPDSVTSIGNATFQYCTSLASITIPDSVTSIGYGAFDGCTSLASITIPDSVTSIGDVAFYDCTSLASITFKGTKAQWQEIIKGSSWNYNIPANCVVCTDGELSI